MRETAAVIGGPVPLVGVVADPEARPKAGDSPVVLLLNAGLIHHVGPNRLHVTVARRLAAGGFASLRFDFSGIGDSPPRREDATLDAAVRHDAESVMEFLARTRGARQFILMGLCQGAHVAFRIACEDPRVVGVVMIDGYAYHTLGYHVRRVLRGVRRAQSWRSFIGGLGERAKGILHMYRGSRADPLADLVPEDLNRMPSKAEVLVDLRALLARGTRCLFIFTERGMLHYYNHERQLFEMFPGFRGHRGIEVAFLRGTDHTFTLLHHQSIVVDVIERWAHALWAVPSPASEPLSGPNGAISDGRMRRRVGR